MYYKDLIIDEKEQKYLIMIYKFIINLNCLKKKFCDVYKEYKNYLSKYFYENINYISSFDNIINIFINNFSINDNNSINNCLCSKELYIIFKSLNDYYQNKLKNNFIINKLSLINDYKKENHKNIIQCIYQQESIISYILYFTFELDSKEKKKYLIVSSNNGMINSISFIEKDF
jgi:hypothetical protein